MNLRENVFVRRLVYTWLSQTLIREKDVKRTIHGLGLRDSVDLRILDAGCGIGQIAFWLAERYPNAFIKAIDIDARRVREFGSFLKKANVTKIHCKVERVEDVAEREEFDLIVCCSVLEFVKDEERALYGFHIALNRGGKLVVEVPHQDEDLLSSPRSAVYPYRRTYTIEGLCAILQKLGFIIRATTYTEGKFESCALRIYEAILGCHFGAIYHALSQKPLRFIFLFPLYLVLVHPLVMLLLWLEMRYPRRSGRAFVVIAEKAEGWLA